MNISKKLKYIFAIFFILTVMFLTGSAFIFFESYSDPRWRVFDFNSRQAADGDIYNVAEIPAIKSVRLSGRRTLRFSFTPPIKAKSWTICSQSDNSIVSQGRHPEIQFPDEPYTETYKFIPEGVNLHKEIAVTVSFYPNEGYMKAGLSWPDNYFSPFSSVPFSLKEPYSIEEWAGFTENDPEIIEARLIMGNDIDMNALALERSEQVFSFIMDKIKDSGGIPSDEFQDASPLETYNGLSTGKDKGWCENRALAYYIFANAAGVKTRLVDIAGKFGPLKLTGHYFCESWNPDLHRWFFVDPQSSAAHVRTEKGLLLNTLEIKRLFDIDAIDNCNVRTYDRETGELVTQGNDNFYKGNSGYFKGEIVLAYKFGYPKNKSYSKLLHFIRYPTLLYAPFELPQLYIIKNLCITGFASCLLISILFGICLVGVKKGKDEG